MGSEPKKYPLFFSYRDLIAGAGFVSGVEIKGRVLLDMSGEECWMYGVQPGGIAGGGADRPSAFNEFRQSYLSVLYDMAGETGTFKEFKAAVERFFSEVNQPNARDWDEALAEVRRNKTSLEGLNRVDAQAEKCAIRVVHLKAPGSVSRKYNQLGSIHEAA